VVEEEEWFIFVGDKKQRLLLEEEDKPAAETAVSTTATTTTTKEKSEHTPRRSFMVAKREGDVVSVYLIKSDVKTISDENDADIAQVETFVNLCAQSAFIRICTGLKTQ